jgi:hypothetical protein
MRKATFVLLCVLPASASTSAEPRLNRADYEEIGSIVLTHEAGTPGMPWTIFVRFDDFDTAALIPAFQRLYQHAVSVKGSGEDWGTRQADGCHFDKATGANATGIFISPPKWRDSAAVAFQVTFAACNIGTHINTYVLERSEGKWTLKAVERGPMS